jgi:hypothetical protein
MTNTGSLAKKILLIMCTCATTWLSGCAAARNASPVFWPKAPDAPRLQYLMGIKDSADVEEKSSLSLLDLGQNEKKLVTIVKPYGIALHKGKIYVCDTIQAEVIIFDLPGKKVTTLAGNKEAGRLKKPINLAVDSEGYLYVGDTVLRKVLKYSPEGAFLEAIGAELNIKPTGIAVDELFLYVLNSEKGLVQLFDRSTGKAGRSFGQAGDERGRLFSPLGIGLDGKGGVFVTNLDGRIVQFDRDGHSLKMFGKLGSDLSEFGRPRAITIDRAGIMYVVDASFQEVRMMQDDFQILMTFGEPGTRGSLNVPAGIAVSEENLSYFQKLADPDFLLERVIFAVSQFGDRKIGIYGLGKKKGVDYEALIKGRREDFQKKEAAADQLLLEKQQREALAKADKGAGPQGAAPATPAAPEIKR